VGTNNLATTGAVTIVFSEPVNQAAAQAAFSLDAGGAQSGTFSWDASSSKMTFQPSAAMPHGVNATWKVVSGVQDTSGNAMAAQATGSFHVVAQASAHLTTFAPATGWMNGSSTPLTGGSVTYVGDSSGNAAYLTFYTFDFGALPAATTGITGGLLNAAISSSTSNNGGGALSATLGTLYAQSLSYGLYLTADAANVALDSHRCFSTLLAPALGSIIIKPIPLFCPYESAFPAAWQSGAASADVGGILQFQWLNRSTRNNYAQFRLAFTTPTDSDGVYDYDALSLPSLDVTYEYAW
jgi:hypothetical protein